MFDSKIMFKTEKINFASLKFFKSCKFFILSKELDSFLIEINDLNLSIINGWGARIRT